MIETKPNRRPTYLAALLLVAVGATSIGQAQPSAPPAQLVLRPLTPGDVSRYKLPAGTEVSKGSFPGAVATVPVGAPAYLETEVNLSVPASNIVSVTWNLTGKPTGSTAMLQPSPLGTNLPVYEPSDRLALQVADRQLLRPDMPGQYTVTASLTTADGATTNLTQNIVAAKYLGVNTCALCHGVDDNNKVDAWKITGHAQIFTEGIDGLLGHYSQSCLQCHTVGYNTNTNAVNGGFDDIMAQTGWTFPAVQTNGNWAAMPDSLKNVADIQCENCHGPGSQHVAKTGNTRYITASLGSGDCNQCHDAPTHHIKGTEWYNSGHAITTRDPSGPGREGCVGCHTAAGFIGRMNGDSTTNTVYSAIGCQTCHEPHGQTVPADNPHLVRALTPVTFMDGTVVTNAGAGTLCMNCHHSRQNAAVYAASTKGSSRFGPHHGPQGDMLEGVNGFTYGQTIPSSAHRTAVSDTCVTCHMQTVATTNAVFLQAGGHTFKTRSPSGVALTDACKGCHGPDIADFDFKLQDYDGDGVIDGVQTEVQHLMDKLSALLPPAGQPKSSLSITTNWTTTQLEAAYNWLFVHDDGSRGIHNTAYTVGLLKASIATLNPDSNLDGLPDSWQLQYFGSTTNPNAAPNAAPAGDGVPNWLKYSLGLDPTKAGVSIPGGVVWANGQGIVNSAGDDSIEIYTAAEVSFNTEKGKSYQLQSVSSLGGGWQNIGAPIDGTGAAVSYVTPTREGVKQFYRVVHTQ